MTPVFISPPSRTITALLFAVLCTMIGCSKSSTELELPADTPSQTANTAPTADQSSTSPTARNTFASAAADLALQAYRDSQQMAADIESLLEQPSASQLQKAQKQWFATQKSVESLRLLTLMPTDINPEFKVLEKLHFQIAAWPIQPGYIDAFGPHIYSGIVFDVQMPLDPKGLRSIHGQTSDSDTALGLYAMEFLLFGEDGQRSWLMFKPITALSEKNIKSGFQAVEELPRNRRRQLLSTQGTLLAQDLRAISTLFSNDSSFLSHWHSQAPSVQQELLLKSLRDNLTQQMLALGDIKKELSNNTAKLDIRPSQQLADRITAQLKGASTLLAAFPAALPQQLSISTTQCSDISHQISSMAEIEMTSSALQEVWQAVFKCIKQL